VVYDPGAKRQDRTALGRRKHHRNLVSARHRGRSGLRRHCGQFPLGFRGVPPE
jgi:hypothetical protein